MSCFRSDPHLPGMPIVYASDGFLSLTGKYILIFMLYYIFAYTYMLLLDLHVDRVYLLLDSFS